VLARGRVNMDAVTGDPGEQGRFGLHGVTMGRGGGAAIYFQGIPERKLAAVNLFLVYGNRARFNRCR
jgi:hypothetical protein